MSLPPELIEKLRQSGLRLDRQGRFWHTGEEVIHTRLHKTLLRWLDVLPDGRPILRLDDERFAYLEVEDSMLLVTSARWQGDELIIRLNDDSEEELAYDSLSQAGDDALYCRVRQGRLSARVLTQAYYKLAEAIEESPDGYLLRARGKAFPIRSR